MTNPNHPLYDLRYRQNALRGDNVTEEEFDAIEVPVRPYTWRERLQWLKADIALIAEVFGSDRETK